jgi:sporulation protein YlmC with PRC-barrel domain
MTSVNIERTLNVGDIRGKPVLASDTAEKLGEVADVLLHLGEGRVLGILIRRSSGELGVLETRDFIIGHDAIMASPGAASRTFEGSTAEQGMPAQRLVGAAVVTDEGRALGRVSEVHISAERPVAAFKVAENPIQSIFHGGYFLRASVARALSPDGTRMIVPADTLERHAATSPADVL